MHELLIATHNQGKLHEYRDLLPDWRILSLRDMGLGGFEVEETADTFEANALLKARGYGRASSLLTLADDSGLVVDALDGAPGVYSARYGGAGLDDAGRRRYLLEQMRGVPLEQRQARFVCVTIIYDPARDAWAQAQGVCEGLVLLEERDEGQGFGYDPLFQPDGYVLSWPATGPREARHQPSRQGCRPNSCPAQAVGLLSASDQPHTTGGQCYNDRRAAHARPSAQTPSSESETPCLNCPRLNAIRPAMA